MHIVKLILLFLLSFGAYFTANDLIANDLVTDQILLESDKYSIISFTEKLVSIN